MSAEQRPQWAESLFQQLGALHEQQVAMQAALQQLQGTPAPPPPTYPPHISPEAVAALANDPRLADPLKPLAALLAFGHANAVTDEDTAMVQSAYAALVSLTTSPSVRPPVPLQLP